MEVETLWQNLSARRATKAVSHFAKIANKGIVVVCKSLIPPEYVARYRSLYYASQNRSGALKRANNAINEEIEEGKTKQPRY